jgi:hypothetical protein
MTSHLLVDLDSTLCDTRHRWGISPINPTTGEYWVPYHQHQEMWDRYSLACEGDEVVQETRSLIRAWFGLGGTVHIVSGRSSCAEDPTLRWLSANGVPFDTISLKRPGSDFTNHKISVIDGFRLGGIEPDLFLEDYPPLVDKIRAAGVPCLQIIPPYGKEDLLWPRYAM